MCVEMNPQTLRFAWLLCGLITLTLAANTDQASNNQKLLTCNVSSYNPDTDTCCNKIKITGVSERMSQCCGQKAYNPLNEVCCGSELHVNPSPGAKCCGTKLYDTATQLCCGKNDGNETVLDRLSPVHECCFESQFNDEIECCCTSQYPQIQLRLMLSNKTKCCEKYLKNKDVLLPKTQCGMIKQHMTEKEICCTSKSQSEIYSKEEGLLCCGHHYYNPSLWSCFSGRLTPVTKRRTESGHCQTVQRVSKCYDDE